MSDSGSSAPGVEGAAFERLEAAVQHLMNALSDSDARVRETEAHVTELSLLLERFRREGDDPAALAKRLDRLESENRDLRARLDRGRAGVDRILARIRFLESQS